MEMESSSLPPPAESSSSTTAVEAISSTTAAAAAEVSSVSDERKRDKEMTHKTKVIQFLGRTTPIILQNDNGPCPLLAICNVLLLKNDLNLSPDIPEVSQEKLLSLVAERLIDSNSNVNNKDAGYIENQQQNIADAIDLLPRLATGIDVNIKFRRIDDFEFTRECAIFDLLDIPLYHGWIVDPQDDTANAIGSKSYNTLVGELVALESQNTETESKRNPEDDCVDFVAATTAALGVPSPCLSRGISFEDSPVSLSDHQKPRKGDVEEEAELSRILKLSEPGGPSSSADDEFINTTSSTVSSNGSSYIKSCEPASVVGKLDVNCFDDNLNTDLKEESTHDNSETLINHNISPEVSETIFQEANLLSSKMEQGTLSDQSTCKESKDIDMCKNADKSCIDDLVHTGSIPHESSKQLLPATGSYVRVSRENEQNQNLSASSSNMQDAENKQNVSGTSNSCTPLMSASDSDSSKERRPDRDEPEGFADFVDEEPIYEGEESILDSGATVNQNREPMYEGEVILAGQGDKGYREASCTKKDEISPKQGDEISPKHGELVRNFLKSSATQLTIYGLFCLQGGLKERELCVFFRNNHFSTMFKFEGELYILATDQGYLNQPDLVWEKLNEVNGNTVYMTGTFKEFKVENQGSNTWDEQNAVASTADYLANIDPSAPVDPNADSDWQLALALQQQEFEQQPPQRQSDLQQPSAAGGSGLVTGPQVSRHSRQLSNTSKPESKSSKDKCTVM